TRRGTDADAGALRSIELVHPLRPPRKPGARTASAPPRGLAEEFLALAGRAAAEGLSVRECAGRLGVSAGHLNEAVRGATGRTPAALLRESRAREAQRLLVSTRLSVRQVAARVGFDDPAYFCRFFRREVGRSPGDFRKHHDRPLPSLEGGAGAS
ncbi:helix-turn-helix transcriptional regulator, partial [Streptomyces sp. NPDC059082]|uniref:helix-turn-helix transcriptional regulator n=1 Tax=Streptomyces sp. NPDC059082 TaxID=3346720 RepID=UPI0036CD500A